MTNDDIPTGPSDEGTPSAASAPSAAGIPEAPARGLDTIIGSALARVEDAAAAPDAPAETASEPAAPEPALDPEAPAGWPEAERARFAAWPADVRLAVTERFAALDAEHAGQAREHAAYRTQAEPLLAALRPFEDYLQALAPSLGLTQGEMIGGLLRSEQVLRNGSPEERAGALRDIASAYGLDPASLGREEGGAADSPVHELRRQVLDLTRRLGASEDRARQDGERRRGAEIESFKAATNPDGSPAHPHYDRFRAVIEGAMASGEAATLTEAYKLATAPLEEAVAREVEARQKAADDERKAAVARARRAAPVASSAPPPNGLSTTGRGLGSILTSAIDRAGLG